ncbi:MAG: AraC family transcriptional regulator [Planctomycetota bacterium]
MSRIGIEHWITALADERKRLDFQVYGKTAVAADWSFHDRVLDEHLLYSVYGSQFVCTTTTGAVTLGPGALLWLSPGVAHTVHNADPDRPTTLFHFRFRLGPPARPKPPAVIVTQPGLHTLHPSADLLLEELTLDRPHRSLRVRTLLLGMLIDTARAVRESATRGGLEPRHRLAVLRLIENDPVVRTTPAELAEHVGMSHDYFARRFRVSFHESPRRWLVRQRVRRAASRLIESSLTVSQVADEFDYTDLFQFSRQFKLITGLSPRAYRRGR